MDQKIIEDLDKIAHRYAIKLDNLRADRKIALEYLTKEKRNHYGFPLKVLINLDKAIKKTEENFKISWSLLEELRKKKENIEN